MSREVFEYFFNPDELEPFYSELPETFRKSRANEAPLKQAVSSGTTCAEPPGRTLSNQSDRSVETVVELPLSAISSEATDSSDEVVGGADTGQTPAQPAGSTESNQSSRTHVWQAEEESSRTRVRSFISVHALGQNAYCTRSAFLSIETGEEADIDEPMPRLTYLPNFERDRIEEELSRSLRSLGLSFVYSACLIGIMLFGASRQDRLTYYLAGFVFLGNLYWLVTLVSNVVVLIARRRAAINAAAREPDPQIIGIQAVNWWSLLKSGYEIVNYDRPFRHPELPIEGCPWRVLERDSTKIPVIRTGGEQLGARRGELYDKHQVRLVAYALLLESMGHVDVPFGVVVPADSPNGLAMSITPALRERANRFLNEFLTKLRDSHQHDVEPRPPENRNRCAGCPYGEPVEISASEIKAARKSGTSLLVMQNGRGKTYHCQCGDRFGSAPPHAKSIRLGLSAALD